MFWLFYGIFGHNTTKSKHFFTFTIHRNDISTVARKKEATTKIVSKYGDIRRNADCSSIIIKGGI